VHVLNRLATFVTGLYRKPNFRRHYLSALSMHPLANKCDIFDCESMRALLCLSDRSDFDIAITNFDSFLQNAGYPARSIAGYDLAARSQPLAKIRSRVPANGSNTNKMKRNITLVLPYVQQVARLGLHSLWLEHFGSVIPLGFRVVFSVQPNAMRNLYCLNWTDCVAERVLDSMGYG